MGRKRLIVCDCNKGDFLACLNSPHPSCRHCKLCKNSDCNQCVHRCPACTADCTKCHLNCANRRAKYQVF